MKQIRNMILGLFIIMEMASGFEIDPFQEGAPLLETFSTNCLQMTQSQQILKAYVMVGLNSSFQNPKEQLDKAIPIYDKRMHQVRAYFHERLGTHEDAKKAFDEALALWDESKKMLLEAPTKENALQIQKNFLIMINKLLAGTQPLATPDLELISLTGKLCRKPLEVTIDYLMRVWGVEIPNYKAEIKNTIDNYHKNLKTLSENKLNNEESLKLLEKSKKGFKFFEFMYNSKSKFIPSLLSKKADDNFIIIREVKKVFKKQAAQKL
ncbi:MAG: hypothetical protein U9R13_05225 [Campylobacterota bacterium]|nr:hypothetical protein [Campylobacterota bacterium]